MCDGDPDIPDIPIHATNGADWGEFVEEGKVDERARLKGAASSSIVGSTFETHDNLLTSL